MYRLDEEKHPNYLDFFLFAANSNLRCYHTLSELIKEKCIINEKIVFDYLKLRPDAPFDEKTKKISKNYEKYHQYNPTEIHKCDEKNDDVNFIYDSKIDSNSLVGLDITGFTIPDIFRILYVLKEDKKVKLLHVYYTEPKHYLFKDTVFDTYEYLSGERTYQAIPEYATLKADPELLVCFLGFDKNVSNVLFEKVVPFETITINGFPSYLPKLKDISLLNNYSLLTGIDNESQLFTRANNPFSSYNTLCQIKNNHPKNLMNICVLGTKPMALGACFFALNNINNVKVTYLYPQKYASNTTDDSTNSWYYMINFE
jgi:hypothetical protein